MAIDIQRRQIYLLLVLILWWSGEAISWTPCGYLDHPEGHMVHTTNTPWLKIVQTSNKRSMLQCVCPQGNRDKTAHLLLTGPAQETEEIDLNLFGVCSKIGCWWNPLEYLTLPSGATLQGGGLFEHAQYDGFVRVHTIDKGGGQGVDKHEEWVNITVSMSANHTKSLLINTTHSLAFDRASCLSAAPGNSLVLSVRPLSSLAKPTNDIHDHIVDSPLLTSPATSQISHGHLRTLRQVSNTPPRFNTLFYSELLYENNEPGVTVGTVIANDPDVGIEGEVTYSLVASGDESVLSLFEIHSQHGDITVTAMLDHETTSVLTFRVRAEDGGGKSAVSTFTLTVQDLNDNPPTFQQGTYFIQPVSENTQVSSDILQMLVIDEDSGSNGQVTFTILNDPDNTFSLLQTGNQATLTLRAQLDYETTAHYQLTILAHDGGNPVLSSSATVEIRVTDEADSLPVFNASSYSVTLPEDTPPIAYLVTVGAVSNDSPPLAALEFFIVDGDDDGRFSIDQTTGHLSLVATLDYEATQVYSLIVQAHSTVNPSLRSFVSVHVTVGNVNDHAPLFSRSQYTVSVLESVAVPSQVVTVTADDLDLGEFGHISYSLNSTAEPSILTMFAIDSVTGVVSTRTTLDREVRDVYTFTVEARDGGVPPRVSRVTVVIRVTDVNDEHPVFNQSAYTGLILENEPAGSEVTQVLASDSDSGSSSIEYYIQSGNHGNAFAMGTFNGLITSRIRLDREQRSEYTLVVIATDLQFESLPTLVYINVTDKNDERPLFHNTFYTPLPVSEAAPVGTQLLTVLATDRDIGSNALISYTSPDIHSSFTIDPMTGTISIARTLDYETPPNIYAFTIEASDGGQPPLSSSARVEIAVTDENDNRPIFEGSLSSVTVLENQASHTSVLQLSARDADAGSNSDLVWGVVGESAAVGVFGVYDNGLVYTLTSLDRERRDHYEVVVHVSDRGEEPLGNDITISVAVGDEIDYPPIFSELIYNVRVTVETPANSELLTVQATSSDLESSILYDITSGDRTLFSINQETGVIVTTTTLDPIRDEREYVLQVTAQHFHLSRTVPVVIAIIRDDGIPRLEPLTIYFNVFKSQISKLNFIGRVAITEQEEGVPYVFSLVNSDPCIRRYFSISEDGGEIIVSRGVVSSVYSLNVSVSAWGNATGHGLVLVYVNVLSNLTLSNGVVASFVGVTEASFISLQLEQFAGFISASLSCSREKIEMFGLMEAGERDTIALAFAVRDTTGLGYIEQDVVIDRLSSNQHNSRLSTLVGFTNDVCAAEPCPNLQLCRPVITMTIYRPSGIPYRTLYLGRNVYISQPFHMGHTCHCPYGYNRSDLCTTPVNLCDPSPCYFGGVCTDNVLDYHCECPPETIGKNCSVVCPSLSCDLCQPTPCLYEGVCTIRDRDPAHYKCNNCPWGSVFSGPNCELNTLSFSQGNFVAFSKLQFSANVKFSLEFATVSPNVLLLYSGRDSGRHDYISVELVIGQIRVGVSYGDSPTIVRTESPWQLNDGEWHSVEVELRGGVLSVFVSGCGQGALEGAEYYCQLTTRLSGDSRTLDLTTPLYIGGLEPHIQRSEFISSTSYIGCLANVVVGGRLLDFNAPLRSEGVEIGCPPLNDKCSRSQCSSGDCVGVWNGTVCSCGDESPLCEDGGSVQLLPGFIHIALTSPTSLTHLSLVFRTRSSHALLVQLGSLGSLEVVQGSVGFRRSHDSQVMLTALTIVVDGYVNDGHWHHVRLSMTATQTKLSVDDGRVMTSLPEGGALPTQTITLGAESPDVSSSRFIGCLGELTLNNKRIDLAEALTTPSESYIVTHGGVSSGCGSGDPCSDLQCPDHSTCVAAWRDRSCVCNTANNYRTVGGACVNPCDPNPCLNEGSCTVPPLTSSALFQCNCRSPNTGAVCEGSGRCEAGYHGDQCRRCICDPSGVSEGVCDSVSGSCSCEVGGDYYSRLGDLGCKSCDCHVMGSVSSSCHPDNGQCSCRSNVIGRRCERCAAGYAGLDESGCKEAASLLGSFILMQSYSGYYDNSDSSEYLDLTSELSGALQRELSTFGLPGRFEAAIATISNTSSGLTAVEYQIYNYFVGDHTHISRPSVNTLGSVMQVIVQSGWAGPLEIIRDTHTLPRSCDLFPVMCTGCPEGATRDGIICRPMGLCSGQDGDRDGVPDDCDNCTFTFNPDQDSSLCAPVEGVCPGGVASGLTWSPTSVGSTDQKPCLLPSTGYATRSCEMGGVWGEVNTMGCLSLTGQQLLTLATSLLSGQLLSLGQLSTTLTTLTALTDQTRPLSGSDVQATGKLLSQLVSVLLGYDHEHVRNLVQNCSTVANNLLAPNLSSHWSTTVRDIGFTAEDFLWTLEELFAVGGRVMISLTEGHLTMSPFSGESPKMVAIGDETLTVHVPPELWGPSTTLATISNLGEWLPRLFNATTSFTVATPLLSVQSRAKVTNLTTPINMTFPYRSPLTRPERIADAHCVYWEYGRGWSNSGCGLVARNHTHTTCTCSHLSVFAVLLPETAFQPLPSPIDGHAPEIFTYIVLSLVSMVMLACFVVFACLPSVRTLQSCVHMNLLLSLSLSCLLFIGGINRTEIAGVCACVSVVLMFLLLSCLSWMVADALIIARFLITPPPRTNFIVYLVIVGWLFPMCLCGIPLGAVGIISHSFIQDMGYPNFCWLSPGVVYAFIVPVLILTPLYAIGIVFSFVTLSNSSKDEQVTGFAVPTNKRKVRIALLVSIVTMLLVMATWTLGLLSVYVEKRLEYPFAVLQAVLCVFLLLVHCCNSQVREAIKDKLHAYGKSVAPSVEATSTVDTTSTVDPASSKAAVSHPPRTEQRLTGIYAELEVVTMVTTRPRNLRRQRTPYTMTLPNPLLTPHTQSTPKIKTDDVDWFKIPDPIPLSPLTFSSEHEDKLLDRGEPIYSQILKPCVSKASTDIDHVPSPSLTEVYQEGRGMREDSPNTRGDSPASYLEAEPISLQRVRREDPLWYRQRDSASVEVDPLPYETAVQATTPTIAKQRFEATKLVSRSGESSPASQRPTPPSQSPQLSLASHSSHKSSRTTPTNSPQFIPSSRKRSAAGNESLLLHPRLSDLTSDLTSLTTTLSGLPSALQVHIAGGQYHADGPSPSAKESKVYRHADGSETVQSLV